MTPRENPFRVDRVSALPFAGVDITTVIDRFDRLGRAAIVGPHGVGKSTLLRTIGDALERDGRPVMRVNLPGSATAPQRRAAVDSVTHDAIVLFDGYEQLYWSERHRLRRPPRLLATAHRPTRLPVLVTLRPTVETLHRVLRQLDAEAYQDVAERLFARHRGDLRETLMGLYDVASHDPEA